jgi:hypothetical protein
MISYEVTALVADEERYEAFERFMTDTHIPAVLATGAFVSAEFSRSSPGRYRIRYDAPGRDLLDGYLKEHAPRLRAESTAEFPDGVEFTREEWEVLGQFTRK